MFFKRKDRNFINGGFISDTLISFTLNLMGQSKTFVEGYFGDHTNFQEDKRDEGVILLYSQLDNGCIVGISIQNDHVYKINIFLNNKPSKEDIQNLQLFTATHAEEYHFITMLEPNTKRHYIGFESKIH